MEFIANNAFFVIEKLVSFAIILQTAEFFFIRKSYSKYGVWRWNILKQDYNFLPEKLRKALNFIFGDTFFFYIVIARGIAAIILLIIPFSPMLFILFLTSYIISIRWRGTFNGGSDSILLLVLLALMIQSLLNSYTSAALFATWFITIHAISSYFIAGIIKLKHSIWRQGIAARLFLSQSQFATPKILKTLVQNINHSKALSWSVIAFEVSFPLCLIDPQVCLFYLLLGIIFHLINAYAFGLNRFFWAWLSTYPAILLASYLI